MEHRPSLATEIPRIPPPRMHARKASRSPTRNRLGDDLLADLSPATTLEAFTNPSGKLRASIEAATTSERAFGLRAALASKKIQEWVMELSEWSWPAEGGSVGFEVPSAKRRKLSSCNLDSIDGQNESELSKKGDGEAQQYIGSLLAAEVKRYEQRVEEINDEMDDLNVEDIKRQVLDTHFSPRSRPSSSASFAPPMPSLFASYTKMDDFTAVVTATVLQALPNLSRLMRLMDVWTIRLRILRKVPSLLSSLEDAEVALKSGWNVIGAPVQVAEAALEETYVSRSTFLAIMEVLRRKVTDLGKDLDFMLDTLEGKEDTLPNEWLDRMDLIEKNYGDWAVAGERKVWEGEWAIAEKRRKEKEEAKRLKEEHLAELKAEQETLEIARLQALRDSEIAEAARLDAIAKEETRVKAEQEVARLEDLRLAKIAENAKIEAEKKVQDIARRQAEKEALAISVAKTAREAEIAEASKVEASKIEAARIETEREAKAEELRRIAEDKALELFRLEAVRVAELARLETVKIEAETEARIEAERITAGLQASEMARLEAIQIANAAKVEASRVDAKRAAEELVKRRAETARHEAEKAAEELARRMAEENETERSRILHEAEVAEAARFDADRQALIVSRQKAEAEAKEVLRVQKVKEMEAFRLKAVQIESALRNAREKSGRTTEFIDRPTSNLADSKSEIHDRATENTRILGEAKSQDSQPIIDDAQTVTSTGGDSHQDIEQVPNLTGQILQKPMNISDHNEHFRQDVTSVSTDNTTQQSSPGSDNRNIKFSRNAIISPSNKSVPAASMGAVSSTVAVGLGISALAFLHKSEQEANSQSSQEASTHIKKHEYSDLDGARDEPLLDGSTYDASKIKHHSFEMPQEMILDSGISSPITFDVVEPQTPTLGSPIQFSEHFEVLRSMPPKTLFSSQTQVRRTSKSPIRDEQAFSRRPSTPKSLGYPSSWSKNVNNGSTSPDNTSIAKASRPVDFVSSLDGSADGTDLENPSSGGTGWIVLNPSDTTEHDVPANTDPLQESDILGQPTIAISTKQDGDVESLVTPSHEYSDDASTILSPVLEESLMPSIEIDFLDGTCEACDSYDQPDYDDSPTPRKRTISVGRFDTDMLRSSRTQRDSVSSDATTMIDARLSEEVVSRVGSPQVDSSFLDDLPEDTEHSPSAGRFGYRNQGSFEYSPPPSPSATPRLAKQRSLQVLRTPGFGFNDSMAPETPIDAPSLDNVNVTAMPMASKSKQSGSEDQLQQQISSLLETIPAHIRLSAERDSTPTAQNMRLKKTRRSVTPSVRPSSSMSNYSTTSRAGTPSFTLAPVFSKTTQRSRGSIGNPEIKLYHLSRSTGEPPIKLFVRLVGEHGERVMVRVGGGWADLGEYLKEYASHHGRRSTLEGGEKIEIQDLPKRIASGASISSNMTVRNSGRSSSLSRPGSVMSNRPGSSLEVRKARRSVGAADNTRAPSRIGNMHNEDRSPSTPLPSTKTRVYGTPPSAASATSSHGARPAWEEEESSLGLAGPKAKKVVISERDQEWIDSMKEKVKLASAEKERRTRERERLDREHAEREQGGRKSFGEMDRVGGVKRLFRKGVVDRTVGHKDERGMSNGL